MKAKKDLHCHYPRSRNEIKMAFLKLLEKKNYGEITMTDIAAKSGYARQTIYNNYESKEQILEEFTTDLVNGLIDLFKKTNAKGVEQVIEWLMEPYHPMYAEYFRYMRRHSDTLLVLLKPDNGVHFYQRFNILLRNYQKAVSVNLLKQFNGGGNNDMMLLMYRVAMGDMINTLFQWVQNDMIPDEVIMAKYQTRMWIGGILLIKDTAEDSIYARLVKRMREKNICLLDWA